MPVRVQDMLPYRAPTSSTQHSQLVGCVWLIENYAGCINSPAIGRQPHTCGKKNPLIQ